MTKVKSQSKEKADSLLVDLPKETLLDWYEDMLLGRRFEEKCAQFYGMGRIMGFCHLYIGQEAVSTGAIRGTLTKDDYVITAYRDHVQAISKGVDPKAILAELLGKYTGTTKGKGGSMHIFDREKNFLGGHAIVGGHLPIAAGAAFASKYRGEKRVCLCFLGDGATNIGTFHESLNLASLWKIPVIYIIENNRYGMGTSVTRSSAIEELHQKAVAYNMRNDVCDGKNVLDVYRVVKAAVDHARETCEPSLIEAQTYRFRGHSMSDPIHGHYRSKEEVEDYKKSDPIESFAELLKSKDLIDAQYLEDAEKRVKIIVQECVEFAENSPEPPLEELWRDVTIEPSGE
ncbi:MAG: pyruvate dehydrogenase (acetyl-transferring) E1 component subunit alpha [bacterium]